MGQGGYPELELIKIDSFRGGYELERYSYRCDRLRCTRQIISLLQPRSRFLRSLQPRPGCSRDIGADRAGGGPGLVAPGLALTPGGVRYWSCSVKNAWRGEVLGWVKGLGVLQCPKLLSACGKMKHSRDAFFLQREILKIALNLLGFMHISGLTDRRGSVRRLGARTVLATKQTVAPWVQQHRSLL